MMDLKKKREDLEAALLALEKKESDLKEKKKIIKQKMKVIDKEFEGLEREKQIQLNEKVAHEVQQLLGNVSEENLAEVKQLLRENLPHLSSTHSKNEE